MPSSRRTGEPTSAGRYTSLCEALLSLVFYLDCKETLKRCEAIVLQELTTPAAAKETAVFLHWLALADDYHMAEVEKLCLERIIKNRLDVQSKRLLKELTPKTMMKVVEAYSEYVHRLHIKLNSAHHQQHPKKQPTHNI